MIWFVSLFSWVGKIPAPVRKWGGLAFVVAAFAWTFWMMGQADAKQKAEVREARALQAQAEVHAERMRAIMETVSAANAQVGKTEVRVIRETDNARRAIEAVPGAQRPVDPEAWRIALATMERIRSGELRDGASGGDDPPIGGIVARPVG